jgi:hypothetical protein
MNADAVLNELKDKRLPTYGTAAERKDRLKKQYGIVTKAKSNIGVNQSVNTGSMVEMAGPKLVRKVTTIDKIDQI